MEKKLDQQNRADSRVQFLEQIKICLQSGDYPRAIDVLRGAASEFPKDVEISELEKLAHDGVKRKAEADRLITDSQELFAQQKSAEALQLLRRAYELDKRNSLARAILANALVEHAHSILETDWLEAETLTNQALALNPAHPTANTIRSLIVERKKTSTVDDWVAQASKLQSAGDLFKALAWVAEGLAVHPDDPKLAQIQDAIQRDQGARRRQARRGDLQDLRRMEAEINGTSDAAAKQALAERIQGVAAKYWTDGEILAIANGLLQRLGLASSESSTASPRSKSAAVIFHVPRPTTPKPSGSNATATAGPLAREASAVETPATEVRSPQVPAKQIAAESVSAATDAPSKERPSSVPAVKAPTAEEKRPLVAAQAPIVTTAMGSAPASELAPALSPRKQPSRSNTTILILVSSAAAIVVVTAIFFFARTHPSAPVAKIAAAPPTVSAPVVSTPVSSPAVSIPEVAAPADMVNEPSQPDSRPSSEGAEPVAVNDHPPPDSGRDMGTLVVVAGQDNARVFLNGKLQRPLTHAGQLRVPSLEPKDYVVQVSKSGFQDPPQQNVRIRKGEQAKLVFNLQPQVRLASLTVQGGAPGTTVLVDQTPVGTIQADGTLSASTIAPGDHAVELRKDRFKPRQFKKHFAAGETVSLAAADAALEASSGELRIIFAPADAKVAIAKDNLLTIVSSGVPINVAPGTYTLTARTADRFTRSSKVEIIAGQSKSLNLALDPNGMSKWDDPGAWKHEKDFFIRKGGEFVLYGVVPTSGTFVLSAMPAKGHLLQWVLNYTDPKNYVLFQVDENNFYRSVVRNGEKTNQIIIPDKGDKRSFRDFHIRVSPTEIIHQIRHGDSWTVLDHWTQPGTNLSLGKFGFYIPGNDQVAVSTFAHYGDLNIR